MSQCFPDPYERSGGNMKVKLNLCNNAKKAKLKGATGIDTSTLASKINLAGLITSLFLLT